MLHQHLCQYSASFGAVSGGFKTLVGCFLKGTAFAGNGSHPGEVLLPIRGEMRIGSYFLLASGTVLDLLHSFLLIIVE